MMVSFHWRGKCTIKHVLLDNDDKMMITRALNIYLPISSPRSSPSDGASFHGGASGGCPGKDDGHESWKMNSALAHKIRFATNFTLDSPIESEVFTDHN